MSKDPECGLRFEVYSLFKGYWGSLGSVHMLYFAAAVQQQRDCQARSWVRDVWVYLGHYRV